MAQNHVLGRGKVYFDRFQPNTDTPIGIERYIGNTPSFGLSVETQELDHYSAEEGLRVKDLSVTMQIDMSGTVVTDNINLDNIAMFFFGASSTQAVGALTGEQDAISSVQQGGSIQLGTSATHPAGLQNVSNVSVTGTGGTPTYVLNTDYTVDTDLGRVTIVEGGGIADGTDIEINYDVGAHSYDMIVSGTSIIYGAMRFVAYNGVGTNTNFYLPKVALRPNGEYNLKGDDWQQFGFNLEVLRKGSLERIYANGRPYNIA
jgi:hypothetical protein